MNLLYVGIFSSRGAMADDYICMGNYLSKYCNLYGLIGAYEGEVSIDKAKDMLCVPLNIHKKRSYFNMGTYIKIKDFIKKKKIDMVFFKTPNPVNCVISALLRKTPQLYYIHDYKPHTGTSVFYNSILYRSEKVLSKYCSNTVIASEKLKTMLLQENPIWKNSKVQVVPLGVLDNLLFDLPPAPCDIDVLFFGRIEDYKGVDWFLDIMNRKRRQIKVVIAGKGTLPETCMKQCSENDNITIINRYIEDRELAGLINRTKIVILPYRNATGTQVIQTAFSYKKCVIAADVGNFSEIIDQGINGILVPPMNEEVMLEAVDRILADPLYADYIGGKAWEKVRKVFDNEAIAKQYLELFKSIM